uniref:Uncharacterized protein n=1 Tax=Tetraselmis chuii TaxID=63592 RepID=A0A7S1X610_9CHLO
MIAPVDVTGGRFEYEGDGTEEDALAAKLGPDRPDCRTKAQSEHPVLDGDLLAQLLELPEPMQAEVVAGMHLDPAWLEASRTQQGGGGGELTAQMVMDAVERILYHM